MATISHEPTRERAEKPRWTEFVVRETWASIAISVIGLAVLVEAIYGPDMVTHSAGGDGAVIPSAIVVSFFAFFATWVVAKYGLRREERD